MTVKKMSKILTFILVLAMVLSTVAMAAETPYTVSAPADSLTHGKITIHMIQQIPKRTAPKL